MKSSVTSVTDAIKSLATSRFSARQYIKITVTELSLLSPELSLEGGIAIAIHHDERLAIVSVGNIINHIKNRNEIPKTS